MAQTFRSRFGVVKAAFVLVVMGCGGGAQFTPPPVQLSVSLSNTTVVVPAGGAAVNIPVVIVDPRRQRASRSLACLLELWRTIRSRNPTRRDY